MRLRAVGRESRASHPYRSGGFYSIRGSEKKWRLVDIRLKETGDLIGVNFIRLRPGGPGLPWVHSVWSREKKALRHIRLMPAEKQRIPELFGEEIVPAIKEEGGLPALVKSLVQEQNALWHSIKDGDSVEKIVQLWMVSRRIEIISRYVLAMKGRGVPDVSRFDPERHKMGVAALSPPRRL